MMSRGSKKMKTFLTLLLTAALLVPLVGCFIQTPEYVIIYAPPQSLTNSEPARVEFRNFKNAKVTQNGGQLASD
jgi:hypothetical protein